jgi:hypothetical protein
VTEINLSHLCDDDECDAIEFHVTEDGSWECENGHAQTWTATRPRPMKLGEMRCSTCGFTSANMADLACGHWSDCPHYKQARAAGTLPPVSDRPGTDVPYD